MSNNGEIYTAGNKFYTAAGSDGIDKFHPWLMTPVTAVGIYGYISSLTDIYLSQYIARIAQHKRPGKLSSDSNHVCPVDCPGSTVRSMPRRSL